jgi:hypothetical protein
MASSAATCGQRAHGVVLRLRCGAISGVGLTALASAAARGTAARFAAARSAAARGTACRRPSGTARNATGRAIAGSGGASRGASRLTRCRRSATATVVIARAATRGHQAHVEKDNRQTKVQCFHTRLPSDRSYSLIAPTTAVWIVSRAHATEASIAASHTRWLLSTRSDERAGDANDSFGGFVTHSSHPAPKPNGSAGSTSSRGHAAATPDDRQSTFRSALAGGARRSRPRRQQSK